MNKQQSFEDLEVFQRAYRLSLEVHHKTLTMPKIEQYGLAEQMRRSSKSICANLAEGYGKRASKAEFKRYISIAIGSSDERRVWSRYCFDLGYISEEGGAAMAAELSSDSQNAQWSIESRDGP